MSFSLLRLPDPILIRIFHHLCTPPQPIPPCNLSPAFPLALCSTKLLVLFRATCLQVINAVPTADPLEPIARSDPRFRVRDPVHIRTAVRIGAELVRECYLGVYDCSMENAQWAILEDVAKHCTHVETLSFVDCVRNRIAVTPSRQTQILSKLVTSVRHLHIYTVREAAKLDTLIRANDFSPLSLKLHHVHPKLHPLIIQLLTKRGAQLQHLTLSLESVQPELQRQLGDFILPFLCALANTIAQHMPRLEYLNITTGPRTSPLTALPGPAVGTEISRREYEAVCKAVQDARKGGGERVLKRLVLERVYERLGSVIRLFGTQCGEGTEIEVCLHEAAIVFPVEGTPRITATKMHSWSWMAKELPREYFRAVEHIQLGVDEDCGKSRTWAIVDKIMAGGVHADVSNFRFLCEGGQVSSVAARVRVESRERAREVMRCLSSGFAYAKNVRVLSMCGDVLKYVGVDVACLYSVVGQLRGLEELYVDVGRGSEGVVENLPVLLRGLWTCCRKLRVVRIEIGGWGRVRETELQMALEAVKELEVRIRGVETFNLRGVLEAAVKGWEGGGKRKREKESGRGRR